MKHPINKSLVPPLECLHADTCLPDYWSGHHKAHVSIPVHKGMTFKAIKQALHNEVSTGAIAGSDDRTRDDSGPVGDTWYFRAHAAINKMQPGYKGKRTIFTDLDESTEDGDSVYAYFVFDDE